MRRSASSRRVALHGLILCCVATISAILMVGAFTAPDSGVSTSVAGSSAINAAASGSAHPSSATAAASASGGSTAATSGSSPAAAASLTAVVPAHSPAGVVWTPEAVCGTPAPGQASCDAIRLDPSKVPAPSSLKHCFFRCPTTTTRPITTTTRPITTTTRPVTTTTVAPTTTTVAPTTTTVAPTTTTVAPTTTTVAPTTTTVAPTTTTVAPTTTTVAPTTTTVAPTTTTTTPTPTCAFKVPSSPPSGYGPCDLQSAYNLLTASGASPTSTVAIVDAYNDPNAAADLATYRSQFGLPACTVATGCFRQVNETGGTSLPASNASWSQEISLDLDMVSAICPNCHILLVEANSSSIADLGTGVDTAASLGAVAISNSYGGGDFNGESSYDSYYDHPGVAVTASAGDGGYGVEYPAASPYVTAVGGTSLTKAASTSRGWSETVWGGGTNGTGSGCSRYEAQPSWQTALALPGCSGRIVADVSADANPNTGVSVYDSYAYQGVSGWLVFGGTSVASPIIGAVYALSGNTANQGASYAYGRASSLNDVTSGTNSASGCSPAYLCTGEVGYDGPTGLGTPNGLGAF